MASAMGFVMFTMMLGCVTGLLYGPWLAPWTQVAFLVVCTMVAIVGFLLANPEPDEQTVSTINDIAAEGTVVVV